MLTLDLQARRAYAQLRAAPSDLAANIYLEQLHDRHEVLCYRLLCDHPAELPPIVDDPTIAQAVERYSHEYRHPRGVYLSIDRPPEVRSRPAERALRPDEVDLPVVTDARQILGEAAFACCATAYQRLVAVQHAVEVSAITPV